MALRGSPGRLPLRTRASPSLGSDAEEAATRLARGLAFGDVGGLAADVGHVLHCGVERRSLVGVERSDTERRRPVGGRPLVCGAGQSHHFLRLRRIIKVRPDGALKHRLGMVHNNLINCSCQ